MKISLNGHCERSESARSHIASGVGCFGAGLHYVIACVMLCRMPCALRLRVEASWFVQEKDEMPTDHAVDNWDEKATNVNKHLIPKRSPFSSCKSWYAWHLALYNLTFFDPNNISPTGKSTLYLSELSEVARRFLCSCCIYHANRNMLAIFWCWAALAEILPCELPPACFYEVRGHKFSCTHDRVRAGS